MHSLDLSHFQDSLVLHFGVSDKSISAYTLASTLMSLSNAAKAANVTLNSGHEIEIFVDAIGPGSFRAVLRTVYRNSENVFKSQILVPLVVGVLGNYIYERTLSIDNQPTIEVKTDEVIVKSGADRIIVPRNVYDATRTVEGNSQFIRGIQDAFEALAFDEEIHSFGIVEKIDSPPPIISIPREKIIRLAAAEAQIIESRVLIEDADLQIIKAILTKSRRRWEFVWRGATISAPVLDEKFYSDFFAHEITIAPGDTLRVKLAIKQVNDPGTGIFVNSSYEVLSVNEHIPRVRQLPLADSRDY